MNWTRFALLAGAFYGGTGVLLGAMAAHVLKSRLSPDLMNIHSE